MAGETKRMPFYQDIDGFRIPGCFSPDVFRDALKYEAKETDLFVATYPKCGTTWVQQILFLLYTRGQPTENPLEFWSRTPFLEVLGSKAVEQMTRPGAIKTHLPFHMVPFSVKAKYLLVLRNPKDALVSFYHHTLSPSYRYQNGTFDDFYEIFFKGETDFGDYFNHLLSWYEHRNDSNVMLVTYEELKINTAQGVKKIAKFLGPEYEEALHNDRTLLEKVLQYSSLEYMRPIFNVTIEDMGKKMEEMKVDTEKSVTLPGMKRIMECPEEENQQGTVKPQHIRKGIIGDWRHFFSDDQSRRMDEKIEKMLNNTKIISYWKSINCI